MDAPSLLSSSTLEADRLDSCARTPASRGLRFIAPDVTALVSDTYDATGSALATWQSCSDRLCQCLWKGFLAETTRAVCVAATIGFRPMCLCNCILSSCPSAYGHRHVIVVWARTIIGALPFLPFPLSLHCPCALYTNVRECVIRNLFEGLCLPDD